MLQRSDITGCSLIFGIISVNKNSSILFNLTSKLSTYLSIFEKKNMRKFNLLIILILLGAYLPVCKAQKKPEKVIKSIYNNSQHSDKSYEMLRRLCKEAPGRLPGTHELEKAIELVKETLILNGADSVWLIPVKSSGWKEVKKPIVQILLENYQQINLNAVSLGQSVSTTEQGIDAHVVRIDRKSQIDSLGEAGLKGKIVFLNLKMQERRDYGKMVWQRVQGASLVAEYGAIGVIIRSLTTKYDDVPHTGVMRYADDTNKIPAVALSWQAADSLEINLQNNPDLKVHLEVFCNNPGLINTNNVAGEIKGSKYPNDIFLLTGHLDAWFNTEGANDDGGGVAQIIDVLRIFKELNIRPKRTIRIMPYIDEEQFNTGIVQYAASTADDKQTHLIEIEVDNGIGVPYGFSIQADSSVFTKQNKWRKLLEPYQINKLRFSNSYAESWPLYQKNKIILGHLLCKDVHYFDYHHSANDVFESVDKTNLQSGSAALATFIYLLDKMEVIDNSKRKPEEIKAQMSR